MSHRPDPSFGRSAWGPRRADLRIGDAERNEVVEALGQHYSAGRLDEAELQDRLDRATKAKTGEDLSGLLSDLPSLAPPAVPMRRRHRTMWVALAVLVVLLSVPWHLAAPWPLLWFPRVPWLLVGIVALLLWRRSRHRHAGYS